MRRILTPTRGCSSISLESCIAFMTKSRDKGVGPHSGVAWKVGEEAHLSNNRTSATLRLPRRTVALPARMIMASRPVSPS